MANQPVLAISGPLPIDATEISWLYTPPRTQVPEPVSTLAPILPLEALAWEDFERLCLRLARLEADVEYCQLYGTRGQDQQGIDLYARRSASSKYTVFQCKKVHNFGPVLIKKAVDQFIDEEWAKKTDIFILCTAESLGSSVRVDAVLEQGERLKQNGISFIPWDLILISEKLKTQRELVHDFFGNGWVRVFCGEQAAQTLSNRLEPHQVTTLRARLAQCYQRIFDAHDPGLPGDTSGQALAPPLKARFVLPDIFVPITVSSHESSPVEADLHAAGREARAETTASEDSPIDGQPSPRSAYQPRRPQATRSRQLVSGWLNASRRQIVLGLPGSGKSSLLRFVALDLLDDNPSLGAFAQQWGQYLPIWVPFALWTKLIHDTPGVPPPLHKLLNRWFSMWGEEALWPLVEEALADGRLLLLVDGLDEWTSEAAARVALDQMKVFAEQLDIPALASSRPHGFRQLGAQSLGWQIGEISGLSRDQQLTLGATWFSDRLTHLGVASADVAGGEFATRGHVLAEEFLSDLERSPDLKELAEVPLLFLLLVVLKQANVDLPRSRFEAYQSLIKHLAKVHPRGRRKAASVASDEPIPLSDGEFEAALAKLAHVLHAEYGGGQIAAADAVTVLTSYLKDDVEGLGYGHRDAREMATKIVESCENAVGLLVRRSETEIAFFHRSFEEFLAALYLSVKPREERVAFVAAHCADAAWREVLLGLFHLTRVPGEVGAYVEATEAASLSAHERLAADLLLSETVFGDYGCPPPTVRRVAVAAFDEIEYGQWMPHRQRILTLALGGLRSARIRDQVTAKVTQWFPSRVNGRSNLYRAIATWPPTEETVECLSRGMHDESVEDQRAAGKALIRHAGSDRVAVERVVRLATSSVSPKTQAAALHSFVGAGADPERLDEIIAQARCSASPELRLAAILLKIKRGTQTEQDRRAVIHLAETPRELDYGWREDVVDALVTGWPVSLRTLTACLHSVGDPRGWRTLDHSSAVMVMVSAYPQNPLVADFIAQELTSHSHGFLVDNVDTAWRWVLKNFKDNPVVVNAIDAWLPSQPFFSGTSSLSVLVGRTAVGKRYLLDSLEGGGLLHYTVPLLLEGWGMADPEVAEAVTKIAWGPANTASWVGRQIQQIIPDAQEYRARMLDILRDPACERFDIMLSALAEGGTEQDKAHAVGIVLLRLADPGPSGRRIGVYGLDDPAYLFSDYAVDERVRDVVRGTLDLPNCNWSAVARFFSDDPQMRQAALRSCNSLPAALRQTVAEFLSDGRSGDTEFALSRLREYSVDADAEVKVRASLGYHHMLKRRGEDTQAAVQALSEGIVSYGMSMSELRQAAFAGLMVLGRYDVVLDARETMRPSNGAESYVDLKLGALVRGGLTTALGESMVSHWEQMRAAMGERFLPFLSGTSYSHYRFAGDRVWSALCPFADAAEAPREEVLAGLEATSPRFADQDILLFLSRVRPSSPLLLEFCLAALQEARGKNYVYVAEALTALEVLGTQFEGDRRALDALVAPLTLHGVLGEADAVALCEVGASEEQLRHAWDTLRRGWGKWHSLFFMTHFHFACRLASTDTVLAMLQEFLFVLDRRSSLIQPIARPLIARIRRDPELNKRLWERLTSGQATASEKSTIPRLLAAAIGMTTELWEWCRAELDAQLDPSSIASVGVDLVRRQVQPVAWSLLDLLS